MGNYDGMANALVGKNQSQAFSAWAKMHQNEIDKRSSPDGYSTWNLITDSLAGIPAMAAKWDAAGGDFGNPTTEALDRSLNSMRAVADKKGQGLTDQDRNTIYNWNQLQKYGTVPK